jgi:hypothetical protein
VEESPGVVLSPDGTKAARVVVTTTRTLVTRSVQLRTNNVWTTVHTESLTRYLGLESLSGIISGFCGNDAFLVEIDFNTPFATGAGEGDPSVLVVRADSLPGSPSVTAIPGVRPRWSPQGSHVALTSFEEGAWYLFQSVSIAPWSAWQIGSTSTGWAVDPELYIGLTRVLRWSPDGTAVAVEFRHSGDDAPLGTIVLGIAPGSTPGPLIDGKPNGWVDPGLLQVVRACGAMVVDTTGAPTFHDGATSLLTWWDDACLALHPTGVISGVVTDEATGDPLPDVRVRLFEGTTNTRTTVTDGNGHYAIAIPDPQADYRLRFADRTGVHRPEYNDDSTAFRQAPTLTVTPGATTTADAALTLDPLHAAIGGVVTDATTAAPLAGITVIAYRNAIPARGGVTDASGRFTLGGLDPTGAWSLRYRDPNGNYLGAYWNGAASLTTADSFTVSAATTTIRDTTITLR